MSALFTAPIPATGVPPHRKSEVCSTDGYRQTDDIQRASQTDRQRQAQTEQDGLNSDRVGMRVRATEPGRVINSESEK